MGNIEVHLLGIGAVKLQSEQATVYIDAFSELVGLPAIEKADLILVTHADGDHFGVQETARAALETEAVVVGPPGIAYPLLANTSLPATQLRILYPIHFKKPIREEVCGIQLKVYQTRHFNDWEPDHVSYLVELEGKRFYITGDSSMLDETDPELKGLDAIFYSLVMDFSTPEAVDAHVSALEKVQRELEPRYLLPNHLLRCEWAIKPSILQEAVRQRGLTGIVTIEDDRQVFTIE